MVASLSRVQDGVAVPQVHTTRIGRRDTFLPSNPPRRIIAHAQNCCVSRDGDALHLEWLHHSHQCFISCRRMNVASCIMPAGGFEIHWRVNDLVCRLAGHCSSSTIAPA